MLGQDGESRHIRYYWRRYRRSKNHLTGRGVLGRSPAHGCKGLPAVRRGNAQAVRQSQPWRAQSAAGRICGRDGLPPQVCDRAGARRGTTATTTGRSSRVSAEAVEAVEALVKVWRAMEYPWSARLVAMLPTWMPHARVHFDIDNSIEQLLLSMSARTIDRALKSHRTALKRKIYGRTKPGTLLKHQIPVRTERWDTREVGWCETDTVAHCGESGEGEFAFSVNLTDIASTWTETRAVRGKGKRLWLRHLTRCAAVYRSRCVASIQTAAASPSIFTATIRARSMKCNSRAVGRTIKTTTKTTTPTSNRKTGRTCAKSLAGSALRNRKRSK